MVNLISIVNIRTKQTTTIILGAASKGAVVSYHAVDPDKGGLNLLTLLSYYMNCGGRNYYLDRNTFVDLVNDMEAHKKIRIDNAVSIPGDNELKELDFSAYDTKYENTVGFGQFYLLNNLVEGYSDWWNFDKKPTGQRGPWGEFKTWVGSAIPGTPFMVLYGVTPPTDQIPKN